MKSKILSIIIPAYNIEDYLKNAVISLDTMLENKFVEVIIVNDGSTDNTMMIGKKLAITYTNVSIIEKKNGGLSDARNFGNNVASGEYIYFFDGDDYLNNHFEEILQILHEKKPDMLCFGYQKVTESGETLSKHLLYTSERNQLINISKKLFLKLIIGRNDEPIAGYLPTKIIRHELIKDIKFLNMNYEDLPFVFELMQKEKIRIVYLNTIIYSYVQRTGSITHSKNEKNLFDKLRSLIIVDELLNKITSDQLTINLNMKRDLITCLWVASLNRSVRSKKIAKAVCLQFNNLLKWICKGNFINPYLMLKLVYYYFQSVNLQRRN